ncbi:hypothetical protein [Halorubellus litoreus]|uniref:Uncharacterized protein n=1 Tax=Halorubellus litoreus TaxID=755308 RepID=A0ABD5VHS9_9EURY
MPGPTPARDATAFDPTHALVVATDADATVEARATADAVDAVLDHADTVAVAVDRPMLADEHPAVADDLRTAFASTEATSDATGGGARPLRAPVHEVRDALASLLALSCVHRFVAVERLDAFRDDRRVLAYVPDHGQFRVDAHATTDRDALRAAVDDALAAAPAGLLPARPLADWTAAGTRHVLEPPSLCVDDACFDLGALERVHLDADDRVVELAWRVDDGLVARALDALGPSRPDRFRFDSANRYADVAAAFRTVADALDVTATE